MISKPAKQVVFCVKFTKIKNDHNRLRPDTEKGVVGLAISLPEVGHPFTVFAEGVVSPDATRIIQTSPVEKIISDDKKVLTFETKSGSLYSVERI